MILQSAERRKDGNNVNQIDEIFIRVRVGFFISSVYPLSAVGTNVQERLNCLAFTADSGLR